MFKRQVYDPPVPSTTHTHAPPVPDTRTAPLPISSVMDAILDTGAAAAASPRTHRLRLLMTSQELGLRRFAGGGLASISAIKPIAHNCGYPLGDDSG